MQEQWSFFGGQRLEERSPGFHLGDDNVPPSVKFAREEAARRKKEEEERRKQDAEDDLAARRVLEERLRKEEEAVARASSPAPQSLDRPAGGTPAPHKLDEDWDDEKYATPPQNSYGVKVKPGSPLFGMERRPPAPQRTQQGGSGGSPKNEMPLWQRLSGLDPKQEPKMTRKQRRESIRELRKQYELRIRESLDEYDREQEAGRNGDRSVPSTTGDAATAGDRATASGHATTAEAAATAGGPDTPVGAVLDAAAERTFLWSPLDAICFELSIARRKLSAYMRELTGMSAQEVIDRIKAERIALKLREMLAARAKFEYELLIVSAETVYRSAAREKKEAAERAKIGFLCEPRGGWASAAGDLLKRVWEGWRTQPCIAWCENARYAARQQFARALGFSSYNRLYRACLLAFGKTVMELEHAVGLELFVALDKEAGPRREAVKAEVLKE